MRPYRFSEKRYSLVQADTDPVKKFYQYKHSFSEFLSDVMESKVLHYKYFIALVFAAVRFLQYVL